VRLLEAKGYRQVGHYAGGLVAWRRAELPLDSGNQRSLRPEQRLPQGTEKTPAGP
jgi:hypothetical protein